MPSGDLGRAASLFQSRRRILRLAAGLGLGVAGCTTVGSRSARGLSQVSGGSGVGTRPADWMTGWAHFRDRFLSPGGRVMDVANGHISHSEGQGYAMVFAVAADDRRTFDRVWRWTRSALQTRPDDRLLSWRWVPDAANVKGDAGHVDDPNNATDGDLLVAWALVRAAQRWSDAGFQDAALALAGDILRLTVLERDNTLMLLPGVQGFRREQAVILNPSYYVFPAIDALGMVTGDVIWQRLSSDGANIIDQAQFGRWHLPPDWLLVRYQQADPAPAGKGKGSEGNGAAAPEGSDKGGESAASADAAKPRLDLPDGFDSVFGFNAIRIPLNLVWGGRQTPDRLRRYLDFWGHFKGATFTPSGTDLTKDTVTVYDSNPGFQAIFNLTSAAWENQTLTAVRLPDLGDSADYYASALWLQAGLAREGWA